MRGLGEEALIDLLDACVASEGGAERALQVLDRATALPGIISHHVFWPWLEGY